jgi:hypothetical protein
MAITPFSVLDTRTKEWKQRKEHWITNYGIQSELGREDTQSKTIFWDTPSTNVSIFDPVLCELMYDWFSPKGGMVLDPFAGGSVRGIVAEEMDRRYLGYDINLEQIQANKKQSKKPLWICEDSNTALNKVADESHDFIFTCPPYYDLEVYTDNPNDISNMDVNQFDTIYNEILQKSVKKLKNNRFFAIVVSEVREPSKTGNYSIGKYRRLVSKTIDMLEGSGLSFYNDMVLFNSQHQASRIGKTYFNRNRKIPSVHQNVLVFVKGNPDIATIEMEGGEPICQVNGTKYLTFRHAAIDIDADKLVASEVERRCRSTKSSYKDWQVIGEETKPIIKYEVGGVPFESPLQISELSGLTPMECRNRIESKNPIYRHWIKSEGWDVTYSEMEDVWKCGLELEKPTIDIEGRLFYSLKEAGEYLNISSERVRQKLNDDKFNRWIYLYK